MNGAPAPYHNAQDPQPGGKGPFWTCLVLFLAAAAVCVFLWVKFNAASEQLAVKEKEFALIKYEADDLTSKLSDIDKDAQKTQRDLGDLKKQMAKLERERDDLAKTNEGLAAAKKELDGCRAQEQDAQRQKDTAEKRGATLQQSLDDCNKTAADAGLCRETLVAMQRDLAACRQTMSDLQTSRKDDAVPQLDTVEMERLQVELEACLRKPAAKLEPALAANAEAAALEKRAKEATGAYESLLQNLKKEIQEKNVVIARYKDMVTIAIVGQIIFDTASVTVASSGRELLDKIAPTLKNVKDKNIYVMGHTDSQGIAPHLAQRFPTNWELSSARASAVVRYLMEKSGVDPEQLAAVGRSSYKPAADNESDAGRARNRRVEILIAPAL